MESLYLLSFHHVPLGLGGKPESESFPCTEGPGLVVIDLSRPIKRQWHHVKHSAVPKQKTNPNDE